MSRVSILKTIGRVIALVLLLLSSMGPWFTDSHPATEESCIAPLVRVGNGHCNCLVSLVAFKEAVIGGQSSLWWLCLPPVLPILFTLLLFLGRGRRFLWFFYLTAWGLVSAFSLSLFIESWYFNRALFLWRAGLCGVVAVVLLAGEILIAIRQLDKDRGLLLQ